MGERETLHGVLDKLQEASRLLQAEAPSPDMPLRVETLLEEAVGEVQSMLGIRPWPEPTTGPPDFETLEEWLLDGCAEATDSCVVEADGTCPHGHPSWLLKLGLI